MAVKRGSVKLGVVGYGDLYTAFAAAIRGEGPQPVPALDAVRTLAVLDAARLSAERGSSVEMPTPALQH